VRFYSVQRLRGVSEAAEGDRRDAEDRHYRFAFAFVRFTLRFLSFRTFSLALQDLWRYAIANLRSTRVVRFDATRPPTALDTRQVSVSMRWSAWTKGTAFDENESNIHSFRDVLSPEGAS